MKKIFLYISFMLAFVSCDKAFVGSDPANNDVECFNLFWNNYDQNYPSFIIKNIDWDSVKIVEMQKINSKGLAAAMIDVGKILKDLHFEVKTSYGAYIESPYPWSNRVSNSPNNIIKYVELESIYNFIIQYGTYNNIGYFLVQDFGLDSKYYDQISKIIRNEFKDKEGIIIDIRGNPGGDAINGDIIAGCFTGRKLLSYKFKYRNGSKHTDFGNAIEHYINPAGSTPFLKPVAILANKRCGSAAEMFCLDIRVLPNAFIVGDTTSGTITDNEYQELPNGWVYRMPIAYVLTPNNEIFEGKGVPPDYPLWITKQDSIQRRDVIFEKAVELIVNKKSKP